MSEAAQDPAQIGPFVVLRRLGEGSMGVVYAGFDVALDRKVAIKLLHRHLVDRPEVRARMLREAQALARLSSPHVVQVYQVGEYDGGVYMAMEYIDGMTLGEWLRARARPWQVVLRTICDAGRGLAAAHHAGLTHRDFKPDNVLVDAEGRARVLDFGLALSEAGTSQSQLGATAPEADPTAEATEGSVRLTQPGKALGTPAYMSPEQHFGGPVGPRADQFSFCVTLYEALYGARPFGGDTWTSIRLQVMCGVVPPPPAEHRVPRRVFRALVRGLSVAPEARWPSLDALLAALESDPWRARLRIAAVVSLIGVTSTASYLAAAARTGGVARCEGASAALASVWDEDREVAVARAFAATRAPFAGDAHQRVVTRLGEYAERWRGEHTRACEANAAGAQSSRVMDLRMACLERRKAQVGALVDIFVEADRGVVERAVQAVAALPSVDACGDVDGLLGTTAPPAEPATAARVESLRQRLARAASLEATGHYEQGLQLAAQVRAEARVLGYAPLDAEAALVEGSLLLVSSRAEPAEAALAHALNQAIVHDLHAIAAEAAAKRLFVLSDGLGRHAEALVTRPFADALVERAGGDDRLAALLSNNLGAAHDQNGDHEAARGHYERSLQILDQASDPLRVVIHHNLGGMYLDEGRLDAARTHYTRARELSRELLGAHHPLGAHPLAGLGDVDAREAAPAHALRSYGDALALMEASYGPDHVYLLHPLTGLGRVHAAAGRADEARRHFERAVAIAERHRAVHPLLAESLEGLAELAAGAGDQARALRLFTRAIETYEAATGRESGRQGPAALRAGELAAQQGDRDAAIAWFERVLALPSTPRDAPRRAAVAAVRLAALRMSRSDELAAGCALLARARAELPADDPEHAALLRLQTRCAPRPRVRT